jgi:hypothetical protein
MRLSEHRPLLQWPGQVDHRSVGAFADAEDYVRQGAVVAAPSNLDAKLGRTDQRESPNVSFAAPTSFLSVPLMGRARPVVTLISEAAS